MQGLGLEYIHRYYYYPNRVVKLMVWIVKCVMVFIYLIVFTVPVDDDVWHRYNLYGDEHAVINQI